ncbi:MAG: helix-turn-helix transcriptional regulator [Proteobacteria bacterium]|nr:helix-turn-helix transcriptional regulator [Pseudomonadota bacterium]
METSNRLRELRETRGLSLDRLAKMVGTTHQQISRLERGERRLTEGWMRRIATALGCRPSELIEAPGTVPAEALAANDVVEVGHEPYALIAAFDARAAAGAGAAGTDVATQRVLFRLGWLRSVTAAPLDQLAVIEVDGDSMEPTLRSGDHVLVDLSQRFPQRKDGLYVLRRDGWLQVKRVSAHPVNGLLTVRSDNPDYESFSDIVAGDVDVIGRVIWLGRRI